MDLVLWRHAEAEPGTPDVDRRLTPKGLKQAVRMAAWLAKGLPDDARVLASPARRTQQTAIALGRRFETRDELALGATVTSVLAAAGWPDSAATVVVVGHQPTLGEVAGYLLAGEPQPWSIRKGAVWWLATRPRDGRALATLRAAIGPDLVSGRGGQSR